MSLEDGVAIDLAEECIAEVVFGGVAVPEGFTGEIHVVSTDLDDDG